MADNAGEQAASDQKNELRQAISEKRGWFFALGVLLLVLGIIAIFHPLLMTIAAKTILGWLILIGGIGQIVHSFSCQRWGGFIFELLVGVAYVIVGGWLALFPLAGIIGLTALLALTFLVEGVLEIMLGMKHRPDEGWVLLTVSGAVALVAGLFLLYGLPRTATWAIGLLVGINLISSGWSFLGLALASQKTEAPSSS